MVRSVPVEPTTFGPFSMTTDYEANDIGGYTGGTGTILAGWAEIRPPCSHGLLCRGYTNPDEHPVQPGALYQHTYFNLFQHANSYYHQHTNADRLWVVWIRCGHRRYCARHD